jgi:uncharacterized protein YcbX
VQLVLAGKGGSERNITPMHVAALYRYPLKGFSPEPCERLSVVPGGRIAGDRVLGLRYADAAAAGDAWGTKHEFVVLVNTPSLACLRLKFDHESLRLRIASGEQVLVDERLDDAGRKRIAAAIEKYLLRLADNALATNPQRLPLRLVGDGRTPRYQDDAAGLVTLHGRSSLDALAAVAGAPAVSESRFRSNIAVEGLDAWEEQGWIGRRVRVGRVEFEAVKPKTRCLATHANPLTGERDLPVMKLLAKAFAAEKPTFAIAMSTAGDGGTIHIGDKVTVGA